MCRNGELLCRSSFQHKFGMFDLKRWQLLKMVLLIFGNEPRLYEISLLLHMLTAHRMCACFLTSRSERTKNTEELTLLKPNINLNADRHYSYGNRTDF